MRLLEIMQTPVLTLTAGQLASDAAALLAAEHVRHAVVLRGDEVVGVISDGDLGGPHGGVVRKGKTVGDLMTGDPIVVAPHTTVAEAVALVRERHIGCLPVLEDGRLVGIVTRSDLLRAFEPGSVSAEPRPDRGAADVPRPATPVSPNRDKMP